MPATTITAPTTIETIDASLRLSISPSVPHRTRSPGPWNEHRRGGVVPASPGSGEVPGRSTGNGTGNGTGPLEHPSGPAVRGGLEPVGRAQQRHRAAVDANPG